MNDDDIAAVAKKIIHLRREEVFEQSPPKAEISNEELLKKLTASLIEHRSPCHDLAEDDIHALKSIIKNKARLAKTKGAVKIAAIVFILKELYMLAKENLHWGP